MEVDVDLTERSETSTSTNVTTQASSSSDASSTVEPQLRQIKLTSVLQLRSAIENDMHSGQLVAPSVDSKRRLRSIIFTGLLCRYLC